MTLATKTATTATKATYSLLPKDPATTDSDALSKHAATVTKVKKVNVPLSLVTSAGLCKSAAITLSPAEEELLQRSYDKTMAIALKKLKFSGDTNKIAIGINYRTNVVTIYNSSKKIGAVSFKKLPGALKIQRLFEKSGVSCKFNSFSSSKAFGPNGRALDLEISSGLQKVSFENSVSYMFPELPYSPSDSFARFFTEKYGAIGDIQADLLKKVNDRIKEINDEKAKNVKTIKDKIEKIKAEIATKNAASAPVDEVVSLTQQQDKLEQQLKTIEKDIEEENKLKRLEEQRKELEHLDMFALRMLSLAMMSFDASKSYPNYYDKRTKTPYNLKDEKHLAAATKFIYKRLEYALVKSGKFWGIGQSENNLSAQQKEYCARVALMLSENREQAAVCMAGVELEDLSPDSLERRIFHKVLAINECIASAPSGVISKGDLIKTAVDTLFKENNAKPASSKTLASTFTGTRAILPPSSTGTIADLSGTLTDPGSASSSTMTAFHRSALETPSHRKSASTSSASAGIFGSTSS